MTNRPAARVPPKRKHGPARPQHSIVERLERVVLAVVLRPWTPARRLLAGGRGGGGTILN